MPERDVLERGERVAADQARETTHVLAQHRIPFVGHGRGALLAAPERLGDLPDLRPLQVTDLERDPLAGTGDDREAPEEGRMPIPGHDLGSDRLGPEPQAGTDRRLDFGRDVREGPDRARELPVGDLLAGRRQPPSIASELRVPARTLEPEGDRLRMDAMRAAHHDGVAVPQGLGADGAAQPVEIRHQQIRRVPQLQRKSGIDDVGRGDAEVEEAPVVTHRLRDRGHEGDHVVLHLVLDFLHTGDVDPRPLAEPARRRQGHVAALRQDIDQSELHVEPATEAGLFGPELAHLGAGVATDHYDSGGPCGARPLRGLRSSAAPGPPSPHAGA